MDLKRKGSRPSQKAPDEHFTGKVRLDPLIVNFGCGLNQRWGAPIDVIHAGDVVEWLEKVTDEQYEGRQS